MKKLNKTDRRAFVKTSAKTLAAGMVFSHLPIFSSANVMGQEIIKLGLVGCGGRGTGAIFQALTASKSVQLVAMGDVFKHELDNSLQQVTTKFADQVAVPKERQFLGLDAFEKVIAECDAVILATPPGFRPQHFQHAIDAGKHVFLEKPLAVDGPGYRKIIETGKKAADKKLNVVVGLQFRYEIAMNEMVAKIHSGEIGDVLSADVYYNVGKATVHPRKEGQTELEYQISNWHYFNWLWGGQLAGQAIHQIDVINWIKQGYPIKASGMGGRAMLEGPDHGEIFDHHYVEFEYADGSKLHVQCRQMDNCANRMGFNVQGTKARADERYQFLDNRGNALWRYRDRDDPSSSQIEQDVFIGAILGSKPYVNNVEFGAESSMTTIMGRMAIESGQIIELDKAKASDLGIVPDPMSWDMRMSNAPLEDGNYAIPKPGVRVL
ncbi:gfo/Idh/MocA family oxidoreductase [Arenibacter sp. N53]|uniref:Gfo/Idh/MocA family protein n=1 Tax=Arenibacter TaxID=178469 RepID=UPI000CD3C04F|nr:MULTISPECIES: Gfo/Idh/MocA family oxidoreductase [Arenibacter]MCM4152831.1 gfo/Idh/MocA family oxidoreductase [Arenibacter sp. N53]